MTQFAFPSPLGVSAPRTDTYTNTNIDDAAVAYGPDVPGRVDEPRANRVHRPSALTMSRVSKSYGPVQVLHDVSIDIPARSVVSIVGENGAGKSTLMNILSGMTAPDSGSMLVDGRPYAPQDYLQATERGISRVFQEQSLVMNVPVYENLLLGQEHRYSRFGIWQDRTAMIAVAQQIVDEAGLDVDVRRKTGDYDFSKRQSIEIARACLAPVHVLGIAAPLVLLDEPTSALDRRDEQAFFDLIAERRKDGAFLFISHRLTEVLAIADIIYVLKDGRVIQRLQARDTDEGQLHGLMVGRERDEDFYFESRRRHIAGFLAVTPPATPVATPVATAEAPVLVVEGLTLKGAYDHVDLILRPGEILGIGGLLDSGKSALGKGIVGVESPDSGNVALCGGPLRKPDIVSAVDRGLAYVPAERLVDGLIPRMSVAWNVTLASGRDRFVGAAGWWRTAKEQTVSQSYIESLRIRSATPNALCERLSGGNQQKVVLARWLCRDPRVLVLDNPTRGIDAGAKEDIYRLIRDLTDQGLAILLITDELLELIGLSNRILIMQRGIVTAEITVSSDDPAHPPPTERELVKHMLPPSTKRSL